MNKAKKTGFFEKLFGGKKSSCCSVEVEQVPETESNIKGDNTSKQESVKNEQRKPGCGC